jgi:hypothetical protein
LAEAQGEPTREERAQAFVASLSALLLMAGDLELGNGIGALIGLRPIDAEALARCNRLLPPPGSLETSASDTCETELI